MKYHIKKVPKSCIYFGTKKGVKILLVKPEGQELIYSWLVKKQSEEVAKFTTKEEILNLKHQLEMKEIENKNYIEKIEILKERANDDKERMDRILKSLDQAQQLQAMAEQKIKVLELEEKEKNKHWWKRG
jgi:hypothetical protein